MQPYANLDKRVRWNRRMFHKFDLTPKRAQRMLDNELIKKEDKRDGGLIASLTKLLKSFR